jgi:hypothetical protein
MRAGWRWAALGGVAAAIGALTACDDCGNYAYRGVEADEYCGTIYGTTGAWYDDPSEADGGGLYEISFGNSAPLDEFSFVHRGGVKAYFLADEFQPGLTFTPTAPRVLCTWTDLNVVLDPNDDVAHVDELATDFEVTLLRRGTSVLLGERRVAIAWRITCGDGVFELKGRDVIGLTEVIGEHPLYDQLARTGALGAPDTGAP